MHAGDRIVTTGEEKLQGTVGGVFVDWRSCEERLVAVFGKEWTQDFQAYWTVADAFQEWCEVTLMPHSGDAALVVTWMPSAFLTLQS